MPVLSYNISKNLESSLIKIDQAKRRLLLTPLPLKTLTRLKWEASIDKVYYSLCLSGINLTKKEIVSLLANPGQKKLTNPQKEAIAYKNALNYIEFEWLASSKEVNSKTLIELYNIAITSKSKSDFKSFRKMNLPRAYARGIFSPRFVGREIPPKRNILRFHPQSHDCGISRRGIKNKVEYLFEYLQKGSSNPIIQAATAQIHLMALSPFKNGSARISRLMSYLILYKNAYDFRGLMVFEEYFRNDLDSLKKAIERVHRRETLTPWLEYFSQAIVTQLAKTINVAEKVKFKTTLPSDFWHLNERQKQILFYLDQPMGNINNKKVQKMFKVSQITASRDLAKLANLNLLFAHGKGRSVYYTKV